MENLEKLGEKLFNGPQGEALRSLAASPAGQALEAKLDGAAVEQAARSGDAQALRAVLEQVLSTEEGRSLAQQLARLGF